MQSKKKQLSKADKEVYNGLVQQSLIGMNLTKAAMEYIVKYHADLDRIEGAVNAYILTAFEEGWQQGTGKLLKFSEKAEANQSWLTSAETVQTA